MAKTGMYAKIKQDAGMGFQKKLAAPKSVQSMVKKIQGRGKPSRGY